MNLRERFQHITHFETPDRGIYCEWCGFWPATMTRWKTEGFPLEIMNRSMGVREDVNQFFGFDNFFHGAGYTSLRTLSPLDNASSLGIDFWPIPRFIPKIIEETDRYIIQTDSRGITSKTIKDPQAGPMPSFIDYPVKTPQDWEKMKTRLVASDPRRYPLDWGSDLIEYYNAEEDRLVGLILPGFYIMPWYMMGIERLLVTYYRDPNFMHEMIDFLTDFYIETMKEAFREVKLDFISIWEDFAYTKGPSISPKIFRDFMLPSYKKITSYAKHYGVDLVGLDTDGDFNALIPLLLEGGVNWLWPLEVSAGMDVGILREKYGKKIRLLQGNIDKLALAAGKDAIDREMQYKMQFVEEGGFIPHVDHHVSSDISFENYLYYNQLLKKHIFGDET